VWHLLKLDLFEVTIFEKPPFLQKSRCGISVKVPTTEIEPSEQTDAEDLEQLLH
jgi:hypothetical protein